MGEELYAAFEKGMQEEAPVSIRLNPFKLNTAQVCVKDRETDVPWCRNAMFLKSRPNFTFDPMLHAGLYYVQEAASMFVDHALREVVKKPVGNPLAPMLLCPPEVCFSATSLYVNGRIF